MSRTTTIALLSAVVIALWLLHPTRQLVKPPGARVIEITYMGPTGPLKDVKADVIREFERESELAHARDPSRPIYRVISGQHAAKNQVGDPTRFLISLAGGSPPDVLEFDRFAIAEWAARGAFEPLDPYIARDHSENRPDRLSGEMYYPVAWNEAQFAGRQYGIPIAIDSRALLYNKNAFRSAGLVDEKGEPVPPRTWEQVREYSRRLTTRDARGRLTRLGFAPMYGDSWLYMYGWMNGGEFMSGDGRRVTLDDPKIVEALTWLKETYQELGGYGQVKSFEAAFLVDALDPFVTGQIAMKIDGNWQMEKLGKFARDVDFGVAPPPVPQSRFEQGHTMMSWTGGFALAIPSTARNKAAAWELIRYLSSERAHKLTIEGERQLAAAQGRFYIPNQSPNIRLNEWTFQHVIYDDPSIPEKYKEACRAFNSLLPHARFRPITPVGQLLWNEHVSATDRALYGQTSPQQALADANRKVQGALDRFLNPIQGPTIRSWSWFFWLYGALLVAAAIGVYRWDTKPGFRRRIAGLFGRSRKATHVIPGAEGGFSRTQWTGGWICAAPWIIGFIIFGGGPMLFSLIISFCAYDIINPAVFTGAHNYKAMAADDELVRVSMGNTIFMVIAVPLHMAVSLAIAMLLNQGIRAMPMWRTVFYLPAIVPMVAASLLWVWVLNPQVGLVNRALEVFGITGPLWLQSAAWSKPALILMGLWSAGGSMIIWLAGLRGIPQSLYEAAAVDGAGMLRQFFHITLPQLTPYIFFNLVMGLIGTFQIFGQAFIMTQGGPVNSTLFYVYHLFNNAFRYGAMGYASAMAWVLLVILLVLTLIQMKLSRRWVHYEGDA